MVGNFYKDLANAKVGEGIVLEVLRNCTEKYEFEDVSNDKAYWHKGDIDAYNTTDNKHYFIDVKMDSKIGITHNILCEEEVYYAAEGVYSPGNMACDYDYLAIISVQCKCIYIIDFKLLKKHFKEGYDYTKNHGDQTTYGTLFPLFMARDYGMLEAIINYEEDGDTYKPLSVVRWPDYLTEKL